MLCSSGELKRKDNSNFDAATKQSYISEYERLKTIKKEFTEEELISNAIKGIELMIEKKVPKLIKEVTDPEPIKDSTYIVATSILKDFNNQNLEIQKIAEEKLASGGIINNFNVTIKNGKKFKLKVLNTTSSDLRAIDAIFCEFYIGRSLSVITKAVNCPLDIKSVKNNYKIQIELLTESTGISLREYWNTLEKNEGMWIGYQIVDALTALGDILMGHIELTPDTIEIDKVNGKIMLNPSMLVPLYMTQRINNEILLRSLFQLNKTKNQYLAPELKNTHRETSKISVERAEVYNCCLLLCELLQREIKQQPNDNIYQEALNFIEGSMQKYIEDPKFAEFIKKCLDREVARRPTLHQLK